MLKYNYIINLKMNKSIQEKLNFIINESKDEKSPTKKSSSPKKESNINIDLAFGTDDGFTASKIGSDSISDEISSFFKNTNKGKEPAKNEIDEEMERFKDRKLNKQKVKDDVEKFIESLSMPAKNVTRPPPSKPSPVKDEASEEQKEEVKVREMTKDFIIGIWRTEEFNKVNELDLSYQKNT